MGLQIFELYVTAIFAILQTDFDLFLEETINRSIKWSYTLLPNKQPCVASCTFVVVGAHRRMALHTGPRISSSTRERVLCRHMAKDCGYIHFVPTEWVVVYNMEE